MKIFRLLPMLLPGLLLLLTLSLQNCKKAEPDPVKPGTTNPGSTTTTPGSTTTTPGTSTTAATSTIPVLNAIAPVGSGITSVSATVSATIDANGGAAISQHGFVYSKTALTPTLADSKTELGATSGPFPLAIASKLTALEANTTYYVRAYATNDKGTGYGAVAQVKSTDVTTVKVNGTVLFGINAAFTTEPTDDKFYALDLETGATKWIFKTGRGYNAKVTVADRIAYIASTKNLYAVDIATGVAKWTYSTTEAFDTPIVDGGIVYISEGQSYNKLLAIDAAKGVKKWELSLATLNASASCPTVANGIVYITSASKLFAVDAAVGTVKWSYTTGGIAAASNPAVVGNVVYVCSTDNYAYAIDATTGSRKWFARLGDWGGSPTVSNGIVYVYSYSGYLLAFDAATGNKKWEYQTKIKGFGDPFIADGLVYVANVAVDAATGIKKLDFTNTTLTPIVVDGVYYAASASGVELSAINVANGGQKWVSNKLTGVPLTPVIIGNDGKVHYPSTSGAQQ